MAGNTYAAVWCDDDGRALVGSVVLGPHSLTLEGATPGRQALRRVRYRDVGDVRLDRSQNGRVGGRPALVLTVGAGRIRISTTELGTLHELAEALTDSTGGAR